MKSSDAVVEYSFRMSDVVDSAVNELVINQEQMILLLGYSSIS